MKTAVIPPIEHLDEFAGGDQIHLVLSHLLEVDRRYLRFYQRQRLQGSYLILDNGAHENTSGEDILDLLRKAEAIRASEIVLPDTLFDHRATVKGIEHALVQMCGPGQEVFGGMAYPRCMLVPQGRTFEEWERCFQDLVAAYVKTQTGVPGLFPRSPVIGISKDYEIWDGGIPRLLEYLEPFRDWMVFDVHLLGWGRHLWVLRDMAERFPWVRSTDSAKPFVYAMAGIVLDPEDVAPEYPKRPTDYFARTMTDEQRRWAAHNVETFRRTAHDPTG